jgi:hypothetical protein
MDAEVGWVKERRCMVGRRGDEVHVMGACSARQTLDDRSRCWQFVLTCATVAKACGGEAAVAKTVSLAFGGFFETNRGGRQPLSRPRPAASTR